ncbi:MAG: di-heme oxidoredictase family protein [Acidobacteriota bacterium]
MTSLTLGRRRAAGARAGRQSRRPVFGLPTGIAAGFGLLCLLASTAPVAQAQIIENPKDPFSFNIPHSRVRLIHSTDVSLEGTSGHLRATDPFLFYQAGRQLLNRQFELEHGVLSRPATMDVPLYVGAAGHTTVHGVPSNTRFARDHSASCGMCHSSVYREAGAGPTIASTGGFGRNSTHFYGAGLVEMISQDMRIKVLNQYDLNGNGLIERAEVKESAPVRLSPVPGAEPIDFGNLQPGADGVPQLNTVFRLWFVDGEGQVLRDAHGFRDERVAAFGFSVQPFGWGRGRRMIDGQSTSQGGEGTTLREFYAVASDFHMGMQAHDPTLQGIGKAVDEHGGLASVSLNGAQQFAFGGSTDRGVKLATTGLSMDDPDGDGIFAELTEGDIDAVEFFLLHTPIPAVQPTDTSELGRKILDEVGCTSCHVADWKIEARNEELGFDGDRRHFHFQPTAKKTEEGIYEIQGEVQLLYETLPSGEKQPKGDAFVVEGIYTDFRHHDLGPNFYERRFDGTLQKEHRTAPLWGLATSSPFGHSGNYLSFYDVIIAHGGAATDSRDAYARLSPQRREQLHAFLRTLVLYSSDEIPADINGDGQIAENYVIGEQNYGYERFDARFLFNTPPEYNEYRWIVRPNGRRVPIGLFTNIDALYGLDLPWRVDGDGDGFPDKLDPLPEIPGVIPEEKEGGDHDALTR